MTLVNPESSQPSPDTTIQTDVNTLSENLNQSLSQKNVEQSSQVEEISENSENPDWRAFREARKRDREERRAAEERAAQKEQELAALKAAMEAAFSQSGPSPQAYQQYYGMNTYDPPEESEDQKIERKVNELLSKREEQFKKKQAEYERMEYPNRLKKDFPDIHHVCSTENLDYLDFHFPEIARPLNRLEDGYDKWYDIYHAIKKLIPNHSTAKKKLQEQKSIVLNLNPS